MESGEDHRGISLLSVCGCGLLHFFRLGDDGAGTELILPLPIMYQ